MNDYPLRKPGPEFLSEATFLVDSSSYIFRAYYAIRAALRAPDGTPTHATFGFVQMLLSLLEQFHPKTCVMVWDRREKGFRHALFPEYKANRSQAPDDLGIQIQNSRRAIDLLGLPQLDCPGYEADDIIATLTQKNPRHNFVIVTADKDLLQLVGPHVWCLDTAKGAWSNAAEAAEKFGVTPGQIPQVQALCGDPVDNIKGAPGVGPKTAIELIQYFGSLEKAIEAALGFLGSHALPPKDNPLKGRRLEAIANHVDEIRLSLKLVTLDASVPIATDPESFKINPPNFLELAPFAQKMGFTTLVARTSTVLGTALPPPPDHDKKSDTGSDEPGDSPSGPASAVILDWSWKLVSSLSELKDCFKAHASSELCVLDTETFGLDTRQKHNIVGFSFSFDGREGYYVPLRHKEGPNLEARPALDELFGFLKNRAPSFKVIFQNAKFDLHIFAGEGLAWPPGLRVDDTMLASFAVDPSESHGMDDLSVKYLGGYQPLSFKSVLGEGQDFSEVGLNDAAFYSAEDAVVTFRLWEILSAKLKECGLWEIYDLLDRPLIQVLHRMESVGVAVDTAYLKQLSELLKKELAEREEKARQTLRDSGLEVAPELNLGSPKQLAHILYEKLGLPVLKKGKTGPSTDASVLAELAHRHAFPRELLEIRELSKLLSTYVDALPELVDPQTLRLHTDFSQTVAVTGRLSSSNPNLQNIPIRTERGKKIRDAFRADPGYLLVGIDYSQIELRVLAYITQDGELVRAFRENADIHRRTAALILKKPEAQVNDDERRMAKAINFGIIYGQSAYGLSRALGIPKAQAQSFIDDYFKTYPGIKKYMFDAVAEAKKHGYVSTLTGRRRQMPDIHSKNGVIRQFAERTAINSPIQGTAADLMKAAMISVQEEFQKKFPQAKMVLQVHDELVFEVPQAEAADLRVLILESLEDPGLLRSFKIEDFSLVTKAEASIGTHWGEL